MTQRSPSSPTELTNPVSVPYFSAPAFKQRLDLVQHLTEYADLLLLIKGPYGVGKTALMRQLLERARDHWMACQIDATPLTTRDQLLADFGDQLGLDVRGIAIDELQSVIEERLMALQKAGRVVLLIVDDAHSLAAPVLDLILHLFELRGGDGKLVRVLLFAEPTIDESLQSPALRSLKQQVTHTLDVPPLTVEQTRDFMEHYCAATGQGDCLPLPPAIVEKAFAASAGIPGRLLVQSESLIRAAGSVDASRSGFRGQWTALRMRPRSLLLAGGAVVLLLILFFQGAINDFFDPDDRSKVVTLKSGPVALPLPEPETRSPPPVIGRLPQVEKAVAMPIEQRIKEEEPTVTLPATSLDARTDSAPSPLAPVPQKKETEPPIATGKESITTVPQPSTQPVVDEKRPAMLDRKWLLSRLTGHYTLQLLGVRDERALLSFVEENHLENKVAYLQTTHQGGPWHVLFYGDYVSREEAIKDRDQLVSRLRGVQPWPRTFASVHEQLNR